MSAPGMPVHMNAKERIAEVLICWIARRARRERVVERIYSEIVEPLEKALREIAKGEGPYSRDELTHCANTVEHMQRTARRALEGQDG